MLFVERSSKTIFGGWDEEYSNYAHSFSLSSSGWLAKWTRLTGIVLTSICCQMPRVESLENIPQRVKSLDTSACLKESLFMMVIHLKSGQKP